MRDIQIVSNQNEHLPAAWESVCFAPLSVKLVFIVGVNHITLQSMTGTWPKTNDLEALSLLLDVYPDWNEVVEC